MEPEAKKSRTVKSLEERVTVDGEGVLCAEGYVMALTRMGYVAPGVWVPEFLLDRPDILRSLYVQFADAGSDVIEAYQYYIDRKNLSLVGKEDCVEEYNRVALRIAREVAEERGLLFAGGIGNTNLLADKSVADPKAEIRSIHEQQARWAKEEGADYIIAETMSYFEEAKIALEVIKSFNLPAVVTLSPFQCNKDGVAITVEGIPLPEACQRLLELGATLVGSNCFRGPATMISVIEDIVKAIPPEKVCALPVAYRTSKEQPTWYDLKDPLFPENYPFTDGLNPFLVTEKEIVAFTKRCMELGVKYMGICCGNMGSLTRAMATTMGREPFLNTYHDVEKLSKVFEYKNKIRQQRLSECKSQNSE